MKKGKSSVTNRPKLGSLIFSTQLQTISQIKTCNEITLPCSTAVYFPLSSSLWSMHSKWITGGQNVMYHNRNADGRELRLSHHSLLTHRLACQPSQWKLSQTSQFDKPPCCLKCNCSMWWILVSVSGIRIISTWTSNVSHGCCSI